MIFPFPHSQSAPIRVGIAGTGFIGSGLGRLLHSLPGFEISRILTRRESLPVGQFATEEVTRSISELVEASDVVVVATGDARHGFRVTTEAFAAQKPVVTMDSEFQVTLGSHFVGKGVITEAEGDQPGSLAALCEEAVSMGFRPRVYGNIKGFLNHSPDKAEMEMWSKRQGISLPMVTSFTDGTKIQIEQAFVANGLGADLVQQGMAGLADLSLEEAGPKLGEMARNVGGPISEYLLNPKLPAGVFIVAEHPVELPSTMKYIKMGEGPFYTLMKPYHLCHLEMPRTIRRIHQGGTPLLNNSLLPLINVMPIAKTQLMAGEKIEIGIGGNKVRGEAVRWSDRAEMAPLGLLKGAKVTRNVKRGEMITLADVEMPDDEAFAAWLRIRERVLGSPDPGVALQARFA